MSRPAIDTKGVLECIKSSDRPIGKKEIVSKTGYKGDFGYCMKSLMAANPEIARIGRAGSFTYIWKPLKEANSEMKNHEGYPDPTAGKALRNVMKSDGKWHRKLEFGEVYSCKDSKSIEGVLIISSKVGTVIGLNVYSKREDFIKDGYFIDWSDKKGAHYVSTISVVNIPEWKVQDKISEIPTEKKSSLMDHIRFVMDLSIPVINFDPVEPKEIIKEVPVKDQALINENAEIRDENKKLGNRIEELEKQLAVIALPELRPVEYRNDPAEIEAAVMKTKIEIYERLIFGDSILKSQVLQAI